MKKAVKLDMKEQYKRNDIALKEARLSPKRRFLLKLAPFIGFLLFLTLMFSDFYEWGDGDISAVSSAVWQLYTTDKKMVQITDQPLKYLTLTKHVNKGMFVETMQQDGWTYLEGYSFERNGQTVQIDIEMETRDIAIVQIYRGE